jgi:hypothetical protein
MSGGLKRGDRVKYTARFIQLLGLANPRVAIDIAALEGVVESAYPLHNGEAQHVISVRWLNAPHDLRHATSLDQYLERVERTPNHG